MPLPHFRYAGLGLVAGAAMLALVAVGCSTNNTAPSSSLVTSAQADSLSEEVTYDADDEISGATTTGSGASFVAAVAPPEAGVAGASMRVCAPTRSPTNPVDSDHDGVPDSVRLTFDCSVAWLLDVDSLTGTIDILDPTPTTADHAIERIFTNYELKREFLTGKSASQTENGIRMSNRDSSVLHQSETNFTTAYVFRDGSTATHERTWTSTFTADSAGTIQADQLLPSGDWNIAGTSSWTRGPNTYALTVSTNPPLHYNATCANPPRFDAGTITLVVTKGTETSTVTITFTGCGTYTDTKS